MRSEILAELQITSWRPRVVLPNAPSQLSDWLVLPTQGINQWVLLIPEPLNEVQGRLLSAIQKAVNLEPASFSMISMRNSFQPNHPLPQSLLDDSAKFFSHHQVKAIIALSDAAMFTTMLEVPAHQPTLFPNSPIPLFVSYSLTELLSQPLLKRQAWQEWLKIANFLCK